MSFPEQKNRFRFDEEGDAPEWIYADSGGSSRRSAPSSGEWVDETPFADRRNSRSLKYFMIAGVTLFLLLTGISLFYYLYQKGYFNRDNITELDKKIKGLDLDGIKDRYYIPEGNFSPPLQRAISLYRNNERAQASREFENFINSKAEDSEKSTALVYLGVMAMESERYPLAKHQFLRALRYHPKSVPALVNLAIVEKRLGNMSDARDYSEQAKRLAPNDPRVVLILGNLMSESSDLAGAIDTYRSGIKSQPEDPYLYYNLAVALLKQERTEEAILNFSKAIELSNTGATAVQAHAHLGSIYYQKGNYEMALDHLQRAVSLAPDNGRYSYNLGAVYMQMGRKSEALTSFQRALDAGSSDPEVWRSLARAFELLNQPTLAVKSLKKSLYSRPDDVTTLFYLGELYEKEKDLINASDTYKKIVNITTGDANTRATLLRLAKVEMELERFNEAMDAVDRARKLSPADAQVAYIQGLVYERAGKTDLAVAAWKDALQYNGNDREGVVLSRDEEKSIRYALADTYRRHGGYDLALNEYKLIHGLNLKEPRLEDDPELQLELGRTYMKLKDYVHAVGAYKLVSQSAKSSPAMRKESFRNMAIAHSMGDRPEDMELARSEVIRATRMDAADPDTKILQATILLKSESLVDREKAVEVLRSVVASDIPADTSAKAYNLLGLAYYKNGDYSRAIHAFDNAVQLDPSLRDAYDNQRAAVNAYEQNQRR